MATKATIMSNMPVPPGMVLREELEARGMTQKQLAQRANRPIQVINEIIQGKKAITPETALELERVLGISAQLWSNLESMCQLTLARNKELVELEKQVSRLQEFPVREMEKRGLIPDHKEKVEKVRALLRFLGIASFEDSWMEKAVGFRITGGPTLSLGALAVWLRQGILEGSKINTQPYDEGAFRKALSTIRSLTVDAPNVSLPKVSELCANAGVAFVVVQEFPKIGANGVAQWMKPDKALIQLSLRWKWADVFWFSFFHEACHILNHKVREVHIDWINRADPTVEAEADKFAAEILIPTPTWSAFVSSGDRSAPAVRNFARELGINPGIVAGRLQKEGLVPYNRLTELKSRFTWTAK